jgi:hypothetical protein
MLSALDVVDGIVNLMTRRVAVENEEGKGIMQALDDVEGTMCGCGRIAGISIW